MNEKNRHEKNTIIRTRVDKTTRARFRAVARSAGKTESELLREIIATAIDRNMSCRIPVTPAPANSPSGYPPS